ncbi:MAG TPA: DUF805 domain-containing protein [Xanthobacteraceae bacterium]
MNFVDSIKLGFSNYVNFTGRACRSEYWYWALFVLIGAIVARIIDYVIGAPIAYTIFGLAVLIPYIAIGVRRLHDTDRSGWWLFLSFIPLVGAIILIIWFCTKGTDGPNRFGQDRLVGMAPPLPRTA